MTGSARLVSRPGERRWGDGFRTGSRPACGCGRQPGPGADRRVRLAADLPAVLRRLRRAAPGSPATATRGTPAVPGAVPGPALRRGSGPLDPAGGPVRLRLLPRGPGRGAGDRGGVEDDRGARRGRHRHRRELRQAPRRAGPVGARRPFRRPDRSTVVPARADGVHPAVRGKHLLSPARVRHRTPVRRDLGQYRRSADDRGSRRRRARRPRIDRGRRTVASRGGRLPATVGRLPSQRAEHRTHRCSADRRGPDERRGGATGVGTGRGGRLRRDLAVHLPGPGALSARDPSRGGRAGDGADHRGRPRRPTRDVRRRRPCRPPGVRPPRAGATSAPRRPSSSPRPGPGRPRSSRA